MRTITTNVAVIGAGTAGLAAYRAARAEGATAVIIEGGPYGTTCARVGCMPSKLLIAAAEAAHAANHAAPFGIAVGNVRVDGEAVMARVRRERDRFVGFVVDGVEALPVEDRLVGYARFVDDGLLQVDDHTRVRAASVVIATGSTPTIPDVLSGVRDRVVVNDDVFAWTTLPRSVAVMGPGVIGLELGQALARLGVRVSVYGARGSVGQLTDPKLVEAARAIFGDAFHFEPSGTMLSATRVDDGVTLRYRRADGSTIDATYEYVLAATGRHPDVRNLGLANTSIEPGEHGVPQFDPQTLQVYRHPVFIAGDANGVLPLLHEAADEGRAAGRNAARYPDVAKIERRAPLAIVFSDPQIALVGARHRELRADTFVTGEVSFEDQGRSRVMLKNRGRAHVYVDRATRRFVGAEMLGPSAEHIGHLLAWSLQMELTVDAMLAMPFYHPVVEEGLRTALRDAAAKLGTRQQ
ncbi:dihydrolipoyl dehydrogenase [Burkholderia multivorans]|uniref:dihydrolipoyl dehydrogenase n=1 Tax=Burkholderia multivorans TaxID=87883 RepID=UPI0020194D43|nr:dihydrolipoyl dehydrogenase [Burkholderia multivorans]MCL4648790.1 dihydrolipoyl dehydrogenase [Burkholderia multivorans]MCL4657646.1 dihydrolipoyl dehydrogenase [Burkholderia multivorans]MCO1373803.1 dihydrolipoyl dehydrogenase [Burkholderia multivorans]MCO1423573.1 dihydrolipoyl dehydrogenase [Burkholderia multivorans]MCO1454940.1 dihydrolipoyl dehydrogenase [Burkholderia multivorans]